MNTPEKTQIGSAPHNFQESPVFNYINSLSPIQPVKSTHISQTITALSFASIQSACTSSYVISRKQPKPLQRRCFYEVSKRESSIVRNEGNRSFEVLDDIEVSQECPAQEAIFDTSFENSEFVIELAGTLKCDCGSPISDFTFHDSKMNPMSEMNSPSASLVQSVNISLESFGTEVDDLAGSCQLDEMEEETGCCWENLICDESNLLLFDSFTDIEAHNVEDQNVVDYRETCSLTSLSSELLTDDDSPTPKPIDLVDCGQHEGKEHLIQRAEVQEQKETDGSISNSQGDQNASEKMDDRLRNSSLLACEADSHQQHNMRRRCLLFEMAESDKENFDNRSAVSQANGKSNTNDMKSVKPKFGNGSTPCMLPGIGLHLNALGASAKDCKIVKREPLASRSQSATTLGSITSCLDHSREEILLREDLDKKITKSEMCDAKNGVLDAPAAFGISEEFNQGNLKKKKKSNRVEQDGDSEGCKNCNCKKSKCLKLYCECFAAGIYCIESCSCLECYNIPAHEDTVLATRKQILSRNPLAFAPKVIRNSKSVTEIWEEPSEISARHKKGCNCKKSGCIKRYCECYQGGVGCTIGCKCQGCQNTFGRKDAEAEEKTETCIKEKVDESLSKNKELKDEEQASVQLPCLPPLPSAIHSGIPCVPSNVAQSPTSRTLESDFVPDIMLHFQDERPEVLKGNCLPMAGVKTASPNSKRVRVPQNEFVFQKSRKLVLKSISSQSRNNAQ
ncbi:protein tesmin/TSO1-like CXC 2 [Papaver somniferum]|uniref:protein tesmin/TSO1-like CXC 2 n=1 Tax=Papaver somniferum TaxID=3469 RepID=UPI000E702AC2|nr:protein tesmin/TSO1-like CXC 2 [Papaver somniferum]